MHLFGGNDFGSGLTGVSPAVSLAVIVGSYCIGCVSTGYYLVLARTGKDIRKLGSGSTGARNVSRVLGSQGFVFTLAGDLVKGGLVVWLAREITGSDLATVLAWAAVVVGHIWPAQLGFQGGKGTATSLAGLLMYNPLFGLFYMILFVLAFSLTRRAVASSLLAYVLLPFCCYLSSRDAGKTMDISVLALLVLVAHYRNVADGFNYLVKRRSLQPEPELPVKEI